MPQAGFCRGCNANVWLNADGSCRNGHPAEAVSGAYETAAPLPLQAPPKKDSTAIVIGIVAAIIGGLLLCGILAAMAVPVFLNASGMAETKACYANQRTVISAAATYEAANPDTTLAADWTALMSVLVPDYLKTAPRCPAGGTYSFDDPTDVSSITCSQHGSYMDDTSTP
jgi:hypothetical protein